MYYRTLQTGRSGDRMPAGATLSGPIQTGPESHPVSCTVGIGSFPGVKRPGRGADHPHPPRAKVTNRYELYHLSLPSVPAQARHW